ncbi:MAG: restriction endonuclease subunit S, partial [Bacteroidetes bacterium]|nr:restriction endonuclease subunit S [Bacteroidota bacterium]
KFVFYFLRQEIFRKEASVHFTSTVGQMRVPKAFMMDALFPLPPLAEQHRIVAKLEALLAQVNAAKDHLAAVPPIIKRFRQSVLSAACSGRMTEDWRREHPDVEPASELLKKIREERIRRYEDEFQKPKAEGRRKPKNIEPHGVETEGLPELPEGWAWTRLENCVDILDGQRIPVNSKEREKRKGDIPYYGATGRVGWIDDYIFDGELLLVGEDGAPFFDKTKHVAYIINGKSWVNNHAHVLRAIKEITSNRFLCNYLNLFDYQGFVKGTTRLKLNQGSMKNIPTPLPPLLEQRAIVHRIENLFHRTSEVGERVTAAIAHADRLTQSILAKAFRGELVPHDLDDAPASVLLERIRKERTELKKKKKPRKRRPETLPDPD